MTALSDMTRFTEVLKAKPLYHGSIVPGLDAFKPALNCTIGRGLYCTSQRNEAIGYARKRAAGLHVDLESLGIGVSTPCIYTVEITGRFLDLRSPNAVREALPEWNEHLIDILENPLRTIEHLCATYNDSQDKIEELLRYEASRAVLRINSPDKSDANAHSFVGHGGVLNEVFAQFMLTNSYTGVIAQECEGEIGGHDSYAIFDIDKIRKTSEEIVGEPVLRADLVAKAKRDNKSQKDLFKTWK